MDPQKKIYVDEIRKIHKALRRKYRKGQDFNQIWSSHCQDDEALEKYAKSMVDLATEIWDEDCDGTHRIKWCVDICKWYFLDGELKKLMEKDKRRTAHFEKDPTEFHCGPNPFDKFIESDHSGQSIKTDDSGKLRLLDVGSCYDPFRKYEEFETTAIDLKPACESVYKCDFLDVELMHKNESNFPSVVTSNLSNPMQSKKLAALPTSFFNVVVFSLLLTYIPSPQARWKMCRKAHQVLKVDGLLLIITPDSSHQNKNALLMKKWKCSIEQIGFRRIKYSKDRHLHFMAFRKVPNDYLWDRRKIESESLDCREEVLNIPQDFQESNDESSDECDANNTSVMEGITNNFDELPQLCD